MDSHHACFMLPRITIQIVGWNSAQELPEALSVLARLSANQVIVRYIDNSSDDESIALVKKYLPQADIVALTENIGWTGGHNEGYRRCDTPYLMVHNPDLVLRWTVVTHLLHKLEQNQRLGAVQGKLLRCETNKEAVPLIDSAGVVLTPALNGRERGANKPDCGQYESVQNILAATGAAAIYRMTALNHIAYSTDEVFDSHFFAYKDDVDVGWRLNNAGWQVKYFPIVVGTHKRAVGARGLFNWGITPRKIATRLASPRTRYSLRNWIWLIIKNASISQLLRHSPAIAVRFTVFLIFGFFQPALYLSLWQAAQKVPLMLERRRRSLHPRSKPVIQTTT